jgi:hypothetical protein
MLYERHGFKAVKFGTSPPPESAPNVEYHWRPDNFAVHQTGARVARSGWWPWAFGLEDRENRMSIQTGPDVRVRDYVGIVLLVFLLLGGWFLFQHLLQMAFDGAQFVAYAVSVFALAISAYSALMTRRLKEREYRQSREGALGTIFSDASEFIQCVREFEDRSRKASTNGTRDWEEIILDMAIYEARFAKKQDRIVALTTQFNSESLLQMQDLYWQMHRHLARMESYRVQLQSYTGPEIEAAIGQKREALRARLTSGEAATRKTYEGIRAVNQDLRELPKPLSGGPAS